MIQVPSTPKVKQKLKKEEKKKKSALSLPFCACEQ